MIPAVSAFIAFVLALVGGVACLRRLLDTGFRLDFFLLAIASLLVAGFILRRAWRFAVEVRDAVDLGDH